MTTTRGSLSRDQIRRIATTGMLMALIAALTLSNLDFIRSGPIAVTTLHLPLLIGLLAEGPVVGFILALTFGLSSLFKSLLVPMSPFDPFFVNPLVSILPRLLIPLGAMGVYWLMNKLLPSSKAKKSITWAVTSVAGSLTNTIFVLLAIYFLYGKRVTELLAEYGMTEYANAAGKYLIVGVGLPNGLLEALLAMILVPTIMVAVTAVKKRR